MSDRELVFDFQSSLAAIANLPFLTFVLTHSKCHSIILCKGETLGTRLVNCFNDITWSEIREIHVHLFFLIQHSHPTDTRVELQYMWHCALEKHHQCKSNYYAVKNHQVNGNLHEQASSPL